MASKIYFKSKHHGGQCFSNEIFNQPYGRVNMLEPIKDLKSPCDTLTIREYINISQVIEDNEMFMILTDSSFTESELKMIQNLVYAHGRQIYGDKKVMNLVNKIEQLLMTRYYLPDDKNEIINK